MFDYIVVGAGTAGCVVASRLAEDPLVAVALIEAGGPYRRVLDIPLVGLWAWLRRPHVYCWQDWTVPQPGLDGRRVFWPAGRLVGGGSSINAMIYSRGHPASYDRWQLGTNPGWSYEALLPYFRRAEDQERGASRWHGVGGPLAVSDSRYTAEFARAFIAGCHDVGIPATDDFNGPQPEGAGFPQVTQRRGRRASLAVYLEQTRGGPRVSSHLGARVTRLLIENSRVTGVEYASGRSLRQLRAEREVILCAGVVRSPQLLMLSGIGPGDALRRLGLDVVADRPGVGENLQDHLRVPVLRHLARPRPTNLAGLLRAGATYAIRRRGLLTSNVCDAAAVVRLLPTADVPQIRIVARWRALPGHRSTVVDFEVALIDPRSRGRVSLVTREPESAMAVDPASLSEPGDGITLARGIELARSIATSPSCRLAGVGDDLAETGGDGRVYIRRLADSAYHPVGTCRMGCDANAVVDSRLRVVGATGLRIADASVMPTTVAGNAQAAVVAIAERAVDLIRG